MPKYITEFIGTFFLVLTIGLAVLSGSALAPLAIGSSLMVMVFMGGHISGAHYNPAVTLAAYLRGVMPRNEVAPYMAAQIIAGFIAVIIVALVTGATFAPAPGADAPWLSALLVEILYTFALCLVVLNVATTKQTDGNSFYGLAIGFTITAAAFAGGPISGGAFNPAVGIGPVVVHAINGGGGILNLLLYIIGPLLGSVLAVYVYRLQQGGMPPSELSSDS